MKKLISLVILLVLLVILVGCKQEPPEVKTLTAEKLEPTSMVLRGEVINTGVGTVFGIRWGVSSAFLNNFLPCDVTTGQYSVFLKDILPGTTIYYQAFADTPKGPILGEILQATTPTQPETGLKPYTGYVTHESVVAVGYIPEFEPATAFFTEYNIKAYGEAEHFAVSIPVTWGFTQGQYPEGLYWGMVQELSKDIGLDLSVLKGQQVEVWRYYLAGGLKGEGTDTHYPSSVNLLVHEQQVKGAWLCFNMHSIGPSISRKPFAQVVGRDIDEWVAANGFFELDDRNADLKKLDPVSVVRAFCDAITSGDEVRAQSCITPRSAMYSLTMNLGPNMLYNPRYGGMNSIVHNITKAKLLSYSFYTYEDQRMVDVTDIGSRTSISISAEMNLTWRDAAFNDPSGRDHRFIGMRKTPLGWKIDGMGTGP